MATVILNPVLTSMSGTVGRMVFYKRYGKTISRAWIMPPNPDTPAQRANRSRFRQAMIAWQGLAPDDKARYNQKARKLGITGHNLFISQYMKKNGDGDRRHPPAEMQLIASLQENAAMRSGCNRDDLARGDIALNNPGPGETAQSKNAPRSNEFSPSNSEFPILQAYRSVTAPSERGMGAFGQPAVG